MGACLIADKIESSTEAAPAQLVGVQAALDDLAARVRAHGPGSTPQELLDQINQVGAACDRTWQSLRPHGIGPATVCSGACNRMWHPSSCLQGALLEGYRAAW